MIDTLEKMKPTRQYAGPVKTVSIMGGEASEDLTVMEATQAAQTCDHRPFLELFQANDACGVLH